MRRHPSRRQVCRPRGRQYPSIAAKNRHGLSCSRAFPRFAYGRCLPPLASEFSPWTMVRSALDPVPGGSIPVQSNPWCRTSAAKDAPRAGSCRDESIRNASATKTDSGVTRQRTPLEVASEPTRVHMRSGRRALSGKSEQAPVRRRKYADEPPRTCRAARRSAWPSCRASEKNRPQRG